MIRQLACSDTTGNWRPSELFVSYFSYKWNARNKQVLIFKFGEDLSYFVILRYKLRDFIKIYDYVNGPIKGDFQKTFSYYFISAEIKVSWNINGFGCIQHVKAY